MTLSESFPSLENCRKRHLELGKQVIEAYGGNIYPVDFLIIAAINRSLCLLVGLKILIEEKNIICAAPIIRMQIDNAMRVAAGTLVSEPHQLVMNILNGIPIKRQEDRNGHKLTDQYLLSIIEKDHKWIRKVYENTSGYIHLSEKHIYNSIFVPKDREYEIKISPKDTYIKEETYVELVEAFIAITSILFEYVEGWIYTKNNPKAAREELRRTLGV
jgi:hypothetical protein